MTDPAPLSRRTFEVYRDVVVLAEGKDEVDLIAHLLTGAERLTTQIHDCGGRDRLLKFILGAVDSGTFPATGRALIIVTDADDDPGAAFTAVRRALAAAGVPVPGAPEVVAEAGRLSTGVFITPGGGSKGAVEQLYLSAADDRRRGLAEKYIDDVGAAKFNRSVDAPAKAQLQALLAALPDSPRQPGDALKGSGLIRDRGVLEPLLALLRAVMTSAQRPVDDVSIVRPADAV